MDWLIVKKRSEKGAARYGAMENFKDFRFKQAVSLKADFPAEAQVQMRKSTPDEIQLVDNLNTMASPLIVNDKVCQLFESEGVKNLELLPINVLNHKGKPVKDRYYAVNILTMADCMDTKKSQFSWNDIDPTLGEAVKKLVIDAAKIPKDVKICRPKTIKYEIMFHRSLVDKITAAKLKGFEFIEIDKYTSL